MGKRRKGRCTKRNQQTQKEPDELIQAPHSFIIHRGLPGGHIIELTKDFRKIMEPFTAANLRERKKNTIKDFVSLSGIFHVSHLCIFTRTEQGMYLKLGKIPRGPTLSFKVHSFSLARDVISMQKKQFVSSEVFKHAPLIVLNNFSGEGMHIKLMASTFQNMFPTININNVKLPTLRRCVLLSYNPTTKLIDFRHYAIRVMPVGLSRGVKKFVQRKVPNLAKCNDISEFLTKSGLLSESEAEDDPTSHVTIPKALASGGNIEGAQSAVKLSELGPRLTIQLLKVEDGLLDGEVLFHELVEKSEEEKAYIQKKREEKRKLKEKRKKQQDMNVQKKEKIKEDLKQKSLEGMKKSKNNTENDRLMQIAAKESVAETNVGEDDDAEYYRQEVGEEPDHDLFSSSRKRPSSFKTDFKSKKPRFDKSAEGNKKNPRFDKTVDRNKKNPRFDKSVDRNKKNPRFDKSVDRNKKNNSFQSKTNKKFGDKKNFSTFRKTKWPGGRGSNPKYGFRKQDEDKNDSSSNKKKGQRKSR